MDAPNLANRAEKRRILKRRIRPTTARRAEALGRRADSPFQNPPLFGPVGEMLAAPSHLTPSSALDILLEKALS